MEFGTSHLTVFDRTGVDKTSITMGYVLDRSAATRLAELDTAAGLVVRRWRLLGGGVTRVQSSKEWCLHVPTADPSSPTHRFSTSTSSARLNPHSLKNLRASIISRPKQSFFRNRATKSALSAFAASQSPLLAIHCTVLADAVCVGITLPHGVFDATGMGFVVHALDAEMSGRSWDVPSGSLLEVMGEAAEGEDAMPARHAGLLRDFVAQTSAYDSSDPDTNVAVASVFSLRQIHKAAKYYPHNAAPQFSLPNLTTGQISSTPLAALALLHRRTLDAARTPTFVQAYIKYLDTTSPTLRRVFGEPGWIFTNQVVARLTDFTALGPLRAFWMYESPLLVDHVVMTNKLEEGFVIMGVLRRREWDAVQKAVDMLARTV